MPVVARRNFRFGPFELDTHTREIYKHGLKLKLQGHPIAILVMLLERPGELITREEIQQKLWPTENETFVDFEHGMNTAVRKLRQALGDEAETPQYIETLPRRGYRFVGQITAEEIEVVPEQAASVTEAAPDGTAPTVVESAASTSANAPVSAEREAGRKRLSYRPFLAVLLVGALVAISAMLFRFARSAPGGLVVTGTRQLTYLGGVRGRILTDGRRIYFSTWTKNPLQYVSVNGGEATAIPSPVSHWAWALHLSSDGSYLLVKELYGPRGGEEAPIWLVDVNSGAARKLGDIEAQDAAFAPDGKTIVVAKQRDLCLTDLQGANPARLLRAPGMVFYPRWSRDGQRMRFTVWDGTSTHTTLWELGRDGAIHPLFSGWKQANSVCCGEWTADGKYYLFQGDGQIWWVRDAPGLSNFEPVLLTTIGTDVRSAVASPVEQSIYVNVELGSNEYDAFKWDLKPGDTPSILYQELKTSALEFSRDGQWIAYSHKTPTGYELWRARADSTEKLQLTTSLGRIYMVRYSPDGRKIAIMARQFGGLWKNYLVSVDGGALHEIPSPTAVRADPAWSPDSQSIMFGIPPEGYGGGGPDVVRHLYLYDLRTDKTSEVPGSTGHFSPRWSPDGRYVVAMTADLQGMSLLDTTTSQWRPLTRHQSTNTPFWSPDSAWVYFNDLGGTGLWRVHVPEARLEALGKIPPPSGYSNCFGTGFAPDGAVLIRCPDSRSDIFALDYKEQK